MIQRERYACSRNGWMNESQLNLIRNNLKQWMQDIVVTNNSLYAEHNVSDGLEMQWMIWKVDRERGWKWKKGRDEMLCDCRLKSANNNMALTFHWLAYNNSNVLSQSVIKYHRISLQLFSCHAVRWNPFFIRNSEKNKSCSSIQLDSPK